MYELWFLCFYHWIGTTWVQEIVWQICNKGAISSEKLTLRSPFLEASASNTGQPLLETLSSPRLIKSHLPYGTIPRRANKDAQCKYIYVARNPKDVTVSDFHFEENMKEFGNGYNGPWEFYSKLFIEGNGKTFLLK